MSCQCLYGVLTIAIILPDFSLIDRQYVELRISIGSDYRRDSCDVEDLFGIICEKQAAKTTFHSCLANTKYRARDCACYACTSIFIPALFYVVKGPAADATDVPQPRCLLCNPDMNMISFFVFPSNGAPVE
jgi:hypothetical protein